MNAPNESETSPVTAASPAVDPAGAAYGGRLYDQHARKLASSAISAEIAAERGYRTADTRSVLAKMGFGKPAQLPPALVIPVFGAANLGEVSFFQCRPDEPRVLRGRVAKYEMPHGVGMVLDCPPRVRPHLGDPSRPLFVTEGVLKGDSLVSAGADAVALLGVWNWRGTNDQGGTTALSDWEAVALNRRRVVVVFDSDVMLNSKVYDALIRLSAFLARRGAEVGYVYLPALDAGSKVGVDDFLAGGHAIQDLLGLAVDQLRRPPSRQDEPELIDDLSDVAEEDGVALLHDVSAWLAGYVAFPTIEANGESVSCADVVALWVVHTHVFSAFCSTPRLHLHSPEKCSGKTRALEALELIVARPRRVENVTAAALFRLIHAVAPTVLLDEVDAVFGPKAADHEDLRAILNAGHRQGATVPRCVGDGGRMEVVEFKVFAPVALAGIGSVPDTVADRAIAIPMRRRAPHEHVKPFRERRARAEAESLRRRLEAWAERHRPTLAEAEPTMPEGVTDRAADVWEALVAIGDEAGGDWPRRARTAASGFTANRTADDGSRGVALLVDIYRVFHETGEDRLSSADLVAHLVKIDESPWGDLHGRALDARGLARRLKPYEITPHSVRLGDKTPKGYQRDDFTDSWSRYINPPPGSATGPDFAATSATATPPATEKEPLTSDVVPVADVANLPESPTEPCGDGQQKPFAPRQGELAEVGEWVL